MERRVGDDGETTSTTTSGYEGGGGDDLTNDVDFFDISVTQSILKKCFELHDLLSVPFHRTLTAAFGAWKFMLLSNIKSTFQF